MYNSQTIEIAGKVIEFSQAHRKELDSLWAIQGNYIMFIKPKLDNNGNIQIHKSVKLPKEVDGTKIEAVLAYIETHHKGETAYVVIMTELGFAFAINENELGKGPVAETELIKSKTIGEFELNLN